MPSSNVLFWLWVWLCVGGLVAIAFGYAIHLRRPRSKTEEADDVAPCDHVWESHRPLGSGMYSARCQKCGEEPPHYLW